MLSVQAMHLGMPLLVGGLSSEILFRVSLFNNRLGLIALINFLRNKKTWKKIKWSETSVGLWVGNLELGQFRLISNLKEFFIAKSHW